MAKFWSDHKNLITGDSRHTVTFSEGVHVTEDPEVIKLLREKAKIPDLGIVEVTPREEEAEKVAPKAQAEKAKK